MASQPWLALLDQCRGSTGENGTYLTLAMTNPGPTAVTGADDILKRAAKLGHGVLAQRDTVARQEAQLRQGEAKRQELNLHLAALQREDQALQETNDPDMVPKLLACRRGQWADEREIEELETIISKLRDAVTVGRQRLEQSVSASVRLAVPQVQEALQRQWAEHLAAVAAAAAKHLDELGRLAALSAELSSDSCKWRVGAALLQQEG